MDPDRLAFHQHRLERLDAQAVQRGRAVQEHRVVLDDLFQDLIHLRRLLFDDLFRPLDRLGDPLLHQLVDDEGLEQLDRHRLGEPALVQPQLRAHDDHRPARVVHALAEQVLTEPALLALEHVGQRLQGPLAAPADRLGAAAVVEQRVHRLLQHALFVPEDDLRRPVQDQLLQPVVAVDDAAVQVVQIARREPPPVQRHERPQVGRDDRDHVQDHPARVVPTLAGVAGVPERVDDLQTLELLLLAVLARLARDRLAQLVRQLVDVEPFEQRPHRGRADVGLEGAVAFGLRLGPELEEAILVEQLLVLHLLLARLDHHVIRVVDHALEVAQGHVEQVAHGRRQRLEEPDVRHRHRELDVAHTLAAHLGQRDLDATAVADDAAVADALVLAAVALPVLYRAENALAEQPVALRLERPVVDGLGLGDLAPRPPGPLALQLEALTLLRVARAPDLLRGGDPDLDVIEARALRLAPAPEIDHRCSLPLLFNVFGGAQGDFQPQGLEFLHQHVEGLGDAGFRQVLPLDDRLVHTAATVHVVRLDREDLLQRVRGAVRFQRPDLHLAEPLAAELRLASERLLGDQRVRPDRAGVNLVVDQVVQLEDVHDADGDVVIERLARLAVEQRALPVGLEARHGQRG